MKVLFALLLVSTTALADDAALLKCRQLDDGPLRLACYNAIPVLAQQPAQLQAQPPSQAQPQPQPARAQLEQSFGREEKKQPAPRLESIDTSIAGAFDGWVPGQRIRLANGQVWQVVDNSEDTVDLVDPKVTVKRGLLGAIFLDIEGAHRNPKVKRVK